jgi:arylformamidase
MLQACDGRKLAADLPAKLAAGGLSLSGLFDLDPIRRTPFLQGDLKLTPASVRRLSPVNFPRPGSPLVALVGGDESDEFLRQNQLIRHHWGKAAVPVCEALPGLNHFTVMHDFVDPAARAHQHALALLGLG